MYTTHTALGNSLSGLGQKLHGFGLGIPSNPGYTQNLGYFTRWHPGVPSPVHWVVFAPNIVIDANLGNSLSVSGLGHKWYGSGIPSTNPGPGIPEIWVLLPKEIQEQQVARGQNGKIVLLEIWLPHGLHD